MAILSLDALDLVSGGMDVRTLHSHLGGASPGGPGFAPLMPHADPSGGLESPLGSNLGVGMAPNQLGLDPNAHAIQAPAPEHHNSFAEDLQAITGIVSAFAGMIGQLTGHGGAGASTANSTARPAAQAASESPDQADANALGAADLSPGPVAQGADAPLVTEAPTGGSHVAGDDGVGGHTNFRETATGFERT